MIKDNVTVRLANQSDLDFVSQDGYLSKEEVFWKIKRKECFVLSVDGNLAGYLRLEFLWSLVPFIALIFIKERYQNKGYSRDLLGFVEKTLKNRGYEVLFSSSQANEPTPQAWHRHIGFEECGVINGINEGGVGEIFFRKKL
ncbi:MAG: GNAT family N-acetyltransferase [Chloroflexota bacterium]|nr:GNAT family N-acetyltransferase [Chloroflexota bacterium]